MKSLNNNFFKKYLSCKIQLHALCEKSRFKKDSFYILLYSELFWFNLKPGWVKFKIFLLSKDKTLKYEPRGKHSSC